VSEHGTKRGLDVAFGFDYHLPHARPFYLPHELENGRPRKWQKLDLPSSDYSSDTYGTVPPPTTPPVPAANPHPDASISCFLDEHAIQQSDEEIFQIFQQAKVAEEEARAETDKGKRNADSQNSDRETDKLFRPAKVNFTNNISWDTDSEDSEYAESETGSNAYRSDFDWEDKDVDETDVFCGSDEDDEDLDYAESETGSNGYGSDFDWHDREVNELELCAVRSNGRVVYLPRDPLELPPVPEQTVADKFPEVFSWPEDDDLADYEALKARLGL
jgi:hypothetical protein